MHPRLRPFFCAILCLVISQSSRAGPTWTSHGPLYKVIKAISISPQDTSVIYAGAFGWGVFKTTDAGGTWVNLTTGLTNTFVRSLAALSNTLVFCGTNDGVFKTTDGGVTWSTSLPTTVSVRSLAYDTQTNSLYAATFGSGLFKSTNQGVSWIAIPVIDPVPPETLAHQWSIAIFGRDSLYVGGSILDIATGGALFRSLDGGASWNQIQRGIGIRHSVHSIAISPINPGFNLIIGTATKGVYHSTNGGLNWSSLNDTATANHLPDFHVRAVAFNTSYRYAGTDSLDGFYSRSVVDAITGWTAGIGLPGPPAAISSIAINPVNRSAVYVGTEGMGVYQSVNSGFNWSGRNSGMLGVAARAVKRTGSGKLILGGDFGDGIWTSTDLGNSWTKATSLSTSNAITSLAITNNPLLVYASAYGSGVFKSTDGGSTWVITDSATINHFPRTLIANPSNAGLVFAGTDDGVYKTATGGLSWQASNNGIRARTSIRSMAMDPTNPNILYVGTDSLYLFKTTDAGGSWTNYTNANGFLPQDVFIRSVTIDYNAPSTVYAGADSGRVYKSTNGGVSWLLHSQIPTTHSVRSILIHPGDHKTFFAASFGNGVFVSADSGTNWTPMNSGLADQTIYTLESDQSNPLNIFAGSQGQGVYHTTLAFVNHPPSLAPIGNKSVLAGNQLQFIVSASDPDLTIPSLSAPGLPGGASFVDSLNGRGLFRWTPTMGQIGSYLVTFHASDGSLSDSQQVMIQVLDPGGSTVISLPVDNGWNLLSLPVRASDPRKRALFPQASSPAFAYAGSYIIKDTLQLGIGYWLKFASSQTIDLGGGTVDRETVTVASGWNMIGSISHAFPVSSVTPIPPVALISREFGYKSGYVIADSIRPGRSYWLKVDQSGKVVLSSGPSWLASVPTEVMKSPPETEGQPLGTLSFGQRSGTARKLYLFSGTSSPERNRQFELPPIPPEGSFDVRFPATQSEAVFFGGDGIGRSFPVRISAEVPDLTLSWVLSEPRCSLSFVVKNGEHSSTYVLQGQGSFDIPIHAAVTYAVLIPAMNGKAGDMVPRTVVLGQNFPNPFNPTTTIEYGLPFSAVVKLVLYDVLGRQVQELVSGEEEAGFHSVKWDAGAASSGVYYYRLEVVNPADPARIHRETRKMFLVR
ncbi:MAG TPA: T9SS type A sorting domain-containing protein [Bacteroidota bacterium]|nr:T9SS type A sorting domain-containing protein [Bacteroidota bacterium]